MMLLFLCDVCCGLLCVVVVCLFGVAGFVCVLERVSIRCCVCARLCVLFRCCVLRVVVLCVAVVS